MGFEIWSSIFLFVCAIIDLKTKKVYLSICVINYIMAVGVKLLLGQLVLETLVLGIMLCGFLFVVSFVTKEAIGQGDIWIIFTLTGILKMANILEILFWALCICSVFSVVMLLIKKVKMKSVLPFVPFLFFSNVLWMILGEKYV